MYENGNSQVIELLMESENIGEFLNKAEYISSISEYDRDMLTAFQDAVAEVEKEEKPCRQNTRNWKYFEMICL